MRALRWVLGGLLALAVAILVALGLRKAASADGAKLLADQAAELALRQREQEAARLRAAADDATDRVAAADAAADKEALDASGAHDLVDHLRGWKRGGPGA